MSADDVVITGVSGRFSNCKNVDEYKDALLDNRDVLTRDHDRWDYKYWGTPPTLGTVPDFDKFDAGFFGVNPKMANAYDPKLRKLLEVVYEAVVDSGTNITELRGSNTGLYLGITQNFSQPPEEIGGINKNLTVFMIANTISYCFDFQGPSLALDTGCASSNYVMSLAFEAIRSGQCDSAIVCGAQSQLLPYESVDFMNFGVLTFTGYCTPFDKNRSGYVKSDCIVALFLQRRAVANRIYMTVEATGINVDGYKETGANRPSWDKQYALLDQTYARYKVNPGDICYLECHGTATVVGDSEECKALARFFANRKEPLLVGSCKSNIGHCESTSGLAAMVKMIIAAQTGIIPATIHLKTLDPQLEGFSTGILKVVTENRPHPYGLMAINTFGFGGANGHVIINPFNEKNKSTPFQKSTLVRVSGRTKEAVEELLDGALKNRDNHAFINLLNNAYKKPIKNHPYRGYQVIGKDGTRQVATVSPKKRPIWFCYTGMGSQYVGMAKDMMQYPVFRETLKKSCAALKPFGMDLEDIILNGTKETFENVVNCFASVVAMSIALTDVLTSLGIVPDGIFGHSLGETACAYADGHITAEEATQIGWARGNSSKTTPLQPGLMAAIGLSYEKLMEIMPKEIEVAAINSNDNCTISGPTQSVKDFLEYCTQNSIFARLVQTGGLAYHSSYIHPSGDKFLKFVQGIIKKPTKRSSKWLSTSVPDTEWNTDLAIYNSAEYHHNNFMNKVLFKQVLDKLPKDAILIEIAPRGLLQAILKRQLPDTITNIHLLTHLEPDNYNFFLSSIGKFYNAGGCPDITPLLPPVTYPVGIDTPMISPLIKWDHDLDWYVSIVSREQTYGQVIEIDLSRTENKYLFDHIVDGIALLPGAGYLDLAWTGFSCMKGRIKDEFPVVVKNVKIIEATLLNENAVLKFVVNIMRTTGKFEILLNNKVASTGYIFELLEDEFSPINTTTDPKAILLDRDETYRYAAVRGYDHANKFQVIKELNITHGNLGKMEWDDNWVTYLDGFVSYLVLYEREGLYLPMGIDKVIINPMVNKEMTDKDENPTVYYNKYTRTARCGGVEFKNITGKKINIKIKDDPIYKSYKFTPFALDNIEENVAHDMCFQTVLQNNLARANFNFVNYDFTEDLNSIKDLVHLRHLKYLNLTTCAELKEGALKNVNLLLFRNFLEKNIDDAKNILSWLPKTSFVYTNINGNISEDTLSKLNLLVVSKFKTNGGCFVLLRQKQEISTNYTIIKINDNKFNWVNEYTSAVKSGKERIYIVSNYVHSGVIGFVNCVKEEYHTKAVRLYFFRQDIKEEFAPTSKFFKDRLELDLAVNVYDKNTWGAYMHWDMPRVTWKNVTHAGLFKQKNLVWQEESVFNRCEANEVAVRYSLVHKWQLESTRLKNLGLEYAGIDRSGNPVMGMTPTGSLKTIVEKVPELTWTIPKSWPMSQAACLPLAMTMTYYGLFVQENLDERHTILIVDENNNFTNMAILYALRTGCLTLVLTDSDSRIAALQKCYPKLQNNILKYTNISRVEEDIMLKTDSKGVDFIFQKIYSISWNIQTCLAKKGKIITLSMGEQSNRSEDDVTCSIVELKDFLKDLRVLKKIHKEIELMIQSNLIKPDVFKCEEITAENLKVYFDNNKETKLVLAKINGENVTSVNNVPKVKAVARTYFDPKKVYIVIGGLGGFGLELANWMVSRGAEKLIINSRSGVKTKYQAHYINQWTHQGVIVKTDSHNTITYDGCKQLLDEALKLGPVGGIFNSALVLRDNLSHELTEQDFVEVVGPKLYSAEHMDKLTRQLCPNLEYFVLISSVASSLGHPGQSNYAYANSAMEILCEQRQKDNLPGVAIEWGPVGQVGFFAKQKSKKLFFDAIVQNIHSCIDALDFFVQHDQRIVSSVVYQKDTGDSKDKGLTSVLDSIAILFGIKSLTEAHMNTTLVNLGMDSITGFEVRNIVMAQFNVDYSAKELRNMTFADIKNLQKS